MLRYRHSWISAQPLPQTKNAACASFAIGAASFPEPELFLWFDGLLEAALAVDQLGPLRQVKLDVPPGVLRPRKRVQADLRAGSVCARGGR